MQYRLKLPSHIRTSDVFNVKHLVPFRGDNSGDDITCPQKWRVTFSQPRRNDAVQKELDIMANRVLSNFEFSFSIISVLTGVTTLYNNGLRFGGPVSIVYGWFIAGSFTMVVGSSMAEICTSYPTSGGLYYWSAKLAGPNWAPFASCWSTGWFNIVGQWAVTTSIDLSLAQMFQVMILLSTGGKSEGGYEASKYLVMAFHGGILLLHAIMNSLPISWLSFFGQLAAAWNVVGVFVLMIILIPTVATERASADFVFTHFNTDNGEGISSRVDTFFVLGLLMSQYTLTGHDASAHMTEETKKERTKSNN